MDQLAAIRNFVRIVERGSITGAAVSLGIPKSTSSKLLADLEHHLGAKLLQRSTRSVNLTLEGSDYYERVAPVVLHLADADQAIQQRSANPQGSVRIDVSSSMAHALLIPTLAEFRRLYPEVELAIGVSDRPVRLIEEAVDCVIRVGTQADSSLHMKIIYTDRVITCAAPAYLSARGLPATPQDLAAKHDTIGYFSAATGEAWPLTFTRGERTVQIREARISSNDSASCIAMMLSGLGVGQAFRTVIRKHLQDGSLIPVLEDWATTTAPISILYPPNRSLSTRVRVFIDWLTDNLRRQAEDAA